MKGKQFSVHLFHTMQSSINIHVLLYISAIALFSYTEAHRRLLPFFLGSKCNRRSPKRRTPFSLPRS